MPKSDLRERREYFKRYNAMRKDSRKEYGRTYYVGHPDRVAARKMRWKKFYATNRDRLLITRRQRYRKTHPAKVVTPEDLLLRQMSRLDKARLKRKLHPEIHRSACAKWRERNRKIEVERARLYRANHPDRSRESARKYNAANPIVAKIRGMKRRAIQKQAIIGDQNVISVWEKSWRGKKSVRCYWCDGRFSPSKCHTDHVIALSKGGPHSIDNLCVSCGKCNNKKYNFTVAQWNSRINQMALL